MHSIFLSYRRNDSAERVSRIYRWLRDHGVPEDEIFFDTTRDSISAGTVFPDSIRIAVENAACVVVVIGHQWLSYRSGNRFQKPNLWQPKDWVCQEIVLALSKSERTIPVTLDQTPMPEQHQLPESIRKLALLQGERLQRGEDDFARDMLTLAGQMARMLTHSLRWDAQRQRFIAIRGERLEYLRALEARYSMLDIPVAQNIRLPASAIYQPLRLRKDPTRPADRSQMREKKDGGEAGEQYNRGMEAERAERAEGESATPDVHTPSTITHADSPDQALRLSSATRRLVVLGGPGSGKTTLLSQLALEATQHALQDHTMPLPIVLSLPALARSGEWTPAKLPNFIASTLDGMNKSLPPDVQAPMAIAPLLAEQIAHGEAFLCLDGLDEVTPTLRRDILGWLSMLPTPIGDAFIVIGSRFTDYREGDLPQGQYIEWALEALTPETRKALVNALTPTLDDAIYPTNSVLHQIDADQLLIQLGKGSAINWWGDSPLLLTLATFVFVKRKGTLPQRRVEIYDEVIRSLLEDRLRRDGIYSEDTLEITYDLLALVALDLFTSIGQVFTVRQLTALTRTACAMLNVAGEDDMNRMYLRTIHSGLLEPQASDTFKFRHPTFQEYLAGAGLAALLTGSNESLRTQAWSLLETKSIMSRWLEPLALMAGNLVTRHGALGKHVASDWIGKLAAQPSSPDGDPGYLALALALHSLRDTAGLTSPELVALQERCIATWVDALIQEAQQGQVAISNRLLTLESEIVDILALSGTLSIVKVQLISRFTDSNSNVRAIILRALGGLGPFAPVNLFAQALSDSIWQVRQAALEALKRLGERVPVSFWIQALQDSEYSVREAAASALGRLGERAPMEPLVQALQDPSRGVREAATFALGRLGERAPMEPLVQALQDSEYSVREAAAFALGRLGERSIDLLVQALQDSEPTMRSAAIGALGRLGERAPMEPLVQALQDSEYSVREAAAFALGMLGERAPMEPLVQALQDPSRWVREAATFALGRLGERAPIDLLVQALQDSEPTMRSAAIGALGRLGERAPIDLLVQARSDSVWWVRRTAIEVLGRLGERAPIEPLVLALQDPSRGVRRTAIEVLGRLGERAPMEPLVLVLKYPNGGAFRSFDEDRFHFPPDDTSPLDIQKAAIEAMGALGERAIEPLIQSLTDPNPVVREAAASGLGRLGVDVPIQPLVQTLSDNMPSVRRASISALRRLGSISNFNELLLAVTTPDYIVRQVAIMAIGALGERAPLDLLAQAFKAPERELRYAAASALGALGEHASVNLLGQALSSLDHDVRERTKYAMIKLGKRAPIDLLVQLLKDSAPDVRRAALNILSALGERAPTEPLVQALQDPDLNVRLAATTAVSALGERAPTEPLVQALQDPEPQMRQAAASAIGLLGEHAPVEPLVQALRDPNREVRRTAIEALGRLEKRAPIDLLVQALSEPEYIVRHTAASALVALGEHVPVEPLVQALRKPNRDVYQAAIQALGRLGENASIDLLIQALSDNAWKVRQSAIAAISKLGTHAPIGPLVHALNERDWEACRAAIESLGKLDDRATVESHDVDYVSRHIATKVLTELAEETSVELLVQKLSDADGDIRLAAITALGALEEQVPIEPLVQALSDIQYNVRESAAIAIGGMGKRNPHVIEQLAQESANILTGLAHTPEDAPALGSFWQASVATLLGQLALPMPLFVEKLADMLEWPHWRVIAIAAEGLGKIKRHIPVHSVNRLRTLHRDLKQPQAVRYACTLALAEILSADPMEDTL